MTMVQQFFVIWWWCCCVVSITDAFPVESKPLNNNPDTWNFGESWLIFNPANVPDQSAQALIASSDGHIKAKKITPKSIFIAPNHNTSLCPHGFRVDENGKCIKTVMINQDDILAERISELFGIDKNPDKNSDIDSDYYDFDDDVKADKDSGPLQINIPLTIDIEADIDGKKVQYIIEEKIVNMRNLDPNMMLIATTTEQIDEITTTLAPVTERLESETTTEPIISPLPTENFEGTTLITINDLLLAETTTEEIRGKDNEETTEPATILQTTTLSIETTYEPTTTMRPKLQRLINRLNATSRLKPAREKFDRNAKKKTTISSRKSNEKLNANKLYRIESDHITKKNTTRTKQPGHRKSPTRLTTEEPLTVTSTTHKPFWWLPKGWTIDESKEKPVLVRFWAQQSLKTDERARSHKANRQRVNSRMPSESIFREITAPELESVLSAK